MFDRTGNLNGCQIIAYRASQDMKWFSVVGIAAGDPSRPGLVKGKMQLFSKELGRSQELDAHACAFSTHQVTGNSVKSQVIAFAQKTVMPDGNVASKLHVIELGAQAGQTPFQKRQAELFFPPEFMGNLNMGSNQITNLPSPSTTDMAANKGYVDSILGSATASATSAAAAAVSETNAATSAQQALSHAQSAANTLDTFDDRFLGAKASAPVVDNDGNALVTGALYFNTTNDTMYVFNGAVWLNFSPVEYGVTYTSYTATEGQTSFTVNYDIGFVSVWMNGVKLLVGTDFTATSGTDIVLSNAASVGDVIDITAHGVFTVADALDQGQADGRYLQISNDLSDLNDAPTARTNLGLAIGTDVQAYSANLASINQNLSTTSDVTFNTIMGNYTAPTTNHGLSTNTSFVVDISDGQIQTLTLGASTTITSTLDNGQQLMLMIDDGSGYTITWSGFTWANNDGVAPSLVTTGYNTFAIWKVNNTNYISYAGDQ